MKCLSVSFLVTTYIPVLLTMCFRFILQIPITLHKEIDGDTMRCGFKIGGGIDQDFHKSPQGYTDNVSVLLFVVVLY